MLLKEPRGKEVGDSDVFTFNAAYSSRLYRVKINAIQLKETSEENKKTNDQVGGAQQLNSSYFGQMNFVS